jgi:hypothetical protein
MLVFFSHYFKTICVFKSESFIVCYSNFDAFKFRSLASKCPSNTNLDLKTMQCLIHDYNFLSKSFFFSFSRRKKKAVIAVTAFRQIDLR